MKINQNQIDLIKRLGDYYYTNANDVGNVVRDAFPGLWRMADNVWYQNVHHEESVVFKTGDTSGFGTDSNGDWSYSDSWNFENVEDWVEIDEGCYNITIVVKRKEGV